MIGDIPPAHKSRRSDARRNYASILEAAHVVIAEQGTQASLRDVARRAGVGLGTLYRHFPTRDALLETLLHQGFQRLVEHANILLETRPADDALAEWVIELADGASTYHGLPASMIATLHDPDSALQASCAAVHDAGARLLHNAQRHGLIRRDITGGDLFALIGAVASLTEHGSPLAARRDHLIGVLLDGFTKHTR
jgi:AcrR family transcriptional regulator